MGTTIAEIMKTDVIWIEPTQPLYEAFQIMRNFNIRHLPVVETGSHKVVGVLSEGDIILHCQKKGITLELDSEVKVEKAMTREVVYCFPSSNVANVAATMISAKINSIPVLDELTKTLLGIVTTTDFLDQLCLNQELSGSDVQPIPLTNRPQQWSISVKKTSGSVT